MIYGKTGEVIKKLFDSLFYIYQIGLEISMKGSDFIFGCVNLLDYECHKTNLNYGGLYMDPPDWIKKHQILSMMIINTSNTLQQLH